MSVISSFLNLDVNASGSFKVHVSVPRDRTPDLIDGLVQTRLPGQAGPSSLQLACYISDPEHRARIILPFGVGEAELDRLLLVYGRLSATQTFVA